MTRRTVMALSVVVVLAGILSPALRVHGAFIRGDVDVNGKLNVVDVVRIFKFMFMGTQVDCVDAVDANDDGALDAGDGMRIMYYVFMNGPPPAPPFPDCGEDPTDDEWTCDRFASCPKSSEGDGFFYVIDRSASAYGNGALNKSKELVVTAITELPSTVRFAVVFYDKAVMEFPADGEPAAASQENKDAAVAWIEPLRGGGGSCIDKGLESALQFADSSTAERNVIVYMGDGGASCPGFRVDEYRDSVLDEVQERNVKKHPIDVIGIGPEDSINWPFLEALAAQNGGTFTREEPIPPVLP